MFKILIAEDDRELRQLFQHVLVKNGYMVKGVSDGKEALEKLEQVTADIALVDLNMKGMGGIELIPKL